MASTIDKLAILHQLALVRSSSKKTAAPTKPRIRVYPSQPAAQIEALIRQALGMDAKARQAPGVRWPESKARQHVSGATCPHCDGTGTYCFHTDPRRADKCYRCNGKGYLVQRDLAYLAKRMEGAGPVCWVRSAHAN